MNNVIDITNISDKALDAILDIASGEETVDLDGLNSMEMTRIVQTFEAIGINVPAHWGRGDN